MFHSSDLHPSPPMSSPAISAPLPLSAYSASTGVSSKYFAVPHNPEDAGCMRLSFVRSAFVIAFVRRLLLLYCSVWPTMYRCRHHHHQGCVTLGRFSPGQN